MTGQILRWSTHEWLSRWRIQSLPPCIHRGNSWFRFAAIKVTYSVRFFLAAIYTRDCFLIIALFVTRWSLFFSPMRACSFKGQVIFKRPKLLYLKYRPVIHALVLVWPLITTFASLQIRTLLVKVLIVSHSYFSKVIQYFTENPINSIINALLSLQLNSSVLQSNDDKFGSLFYWG